MQSVSCYILSEVHKMSTKFDFLKKGIGKTPNFVSVSSTSSDVTQRLKINSRSRSKDRRPESLTSSLALEELVQCTICLERYQSPRMLPCQHTFCLSCLQCHVVGVEALSRCTQEKSKQIQLRCPSCKHELIVDGIEGLEKLPENFYINSVLKVLETSSEPMTPVVPKPNLTCTNCAIVCEFNATKCQHCKQIFCTICWSTHMNDLQEKLSSFATQLEDSELRLTHKVDEMEHRFDQLDSNIKEQTKAKIETLKNTEKELLQQVKQLRCEEKSTSSALITKIDELKAAITNINFKTLGEHQQVPIFMSLHKSTSALINEVSIWGDNRTVFDVDTFQLEEDTEGFTAEVDDTLNFRPTQNPLESLETLAKHYKSRAFTPKFFTTKLPRLTGVAVSPWSSYIYIAAPDNKSILIMSRQKNRLIGKLTSPEILCPKGITFCKAKKEIYVTDKWKHCIHVFASNGEYLRQLCSKGTADGKLISPEGIAMTQNNELVVCDTGNDRILILDPDDGKQIRFIGWNENRAFLNVPTSVAVTEDGKVIVADNGNHRIKIFDMSGNLLEEFGYLGREKRQFRSAEIVALDPLGFIFVGDAGNSRVQIFDQKGNLIRVFGGAGDGHGKFKWISGIAINSQLEVIITDHKNRSLQIF